MTYLNRRSLLWGAAALGAGAAMGRAYAQAPSGPFKLDPLPYLNTYRAIYRFPEQLFLQLLEGVRAVEQAA